MSRVLYRFGRLLLRAYPPDFRRRFGHEMAHHFVTRSREVRHQEGLVGAMAFWAKSTFDAARAAVLERRDQRRMRQPNPAGKGPDSDLGQDIRFAFRTLRRSPGFTIVALLTLALGIGGTTAMFSVLDSAMLQPLPFPNPDRLIMGRATFDGNVNPWVAFPDYMDYRDQAESIESLAALTLGTSKVTITGSGEPEEAEFTFITANLFSTLGVQPILGRTFTIDELPPDGSAQVVLSYDFWQRWYGGDRNVVGKTLVFDGTGATVMGVMPAGFRVMNDADMWVPPWPGNSDPVTRRYHSWLLVGRLAEGVTLEGARAEVDLISTQLQNAYPDSNQGKALQVDDLQDAMVEGYSRSLLLLMGAIGLVLLIACSNVASLLMARASSRTSEMAIRSSLGAGRGRLARQLLAECIVLALGAGALGILLAVWLQDLILGLFSMDTLDIRNVGLSPTILASGLILSLATVLLFGAFPSVMATRTNPAEDLKDGTRTSGGRGGIRLRSLLVVSQVAISLVLLVGSGLLLKSFAELRGVDMGFRVENVFTATISLPQERYPDQSVRQPFFEGLREAVAGLPGVEAVGLINRLPILQPGGNVAIWAPERPPATNRDAPWADQRVVFPGYFEAMDIPVLQGRDFTTADSPESSPVIILSRSTVEAIFPGEEALGRQVAVDVGEDEPGMFQVVGVVEDHRNSSVQRQARPAMFLPYAQRAVSIMHLAVISGNGSSALFRPIQERIWEQDGNLVLSEPGTMEEAVAESIGGIRAITLVLGVFAGVAMALAALGLYGVLAFMVNKQAREIGIRVAMGASRGRVLRLILYRGLMLVLGGSILGIAGALGAAGFVEDLLFRTNPRDPVTFAGVTAVFLLVALGACLIPGWRALRVDPVQAFRTE